MNKVFEVASNVSTPLALAGLFAAIFFGVLKQILNKKMFPRLPANHSSELLKLIIERLFILSLVAMILGFCGFVVKVSSAKDKDELTRSIKEPLVTIEEPLITGLRVNTPDGYQFTGTNDTGQVYRLFGQKISKVEGEPNPAAQDLILDFDVTNPNAMDLRLASFEIEVKKISPPDKNMKIAPVASAVPTRPYFCNLQNKLGLYVCKRLTNNFEFIKLTKNEMEHFGVNINTRTPGVYDLAIWAEYTVGKDTKRAKLGNLGVRFYDGTPY